ncbi:MAG TPA: nitroreductase family deazaflavin-dependent oxidoreductase [Galbitalea sp.]
MARARGALLKHTLNPLTLRMARRGVGPFSLVRHVGRRSGRTYETPIIIQPTPGGFMIELTYGDKVDWYRNVIAAGGCVLRYKGTDHVVTSIEPVDTATGLSAFTPSQRRLLTVLHRSHFVRFLTS